MPTIAVIAQGAMGSAIAGRLVAHGHRVVTVLEGRSTASGERAARAGIRGVGWAEAGAADIFLSVLPPGEALALAERMAPWLRAAPRPPLYVDLNAISPATAEAVAATATAAGARFADAAICGAPPRPGQPGPAIFTSGPGAEEFATLGAAGLDIRPMAAPVGAASAVKMCQSAMTKGYTALAATAALAAMRAGAGEAVREQMTDMWPGLMAFLGPAAERMFDKAYRYGGEMEEIAGFLVDQPRGAEIFTAFARIYDDLAEDRRGTGEKVALLRQFYQGDGAGKPSERE